MFAIIEIGGKQYTVSPDASVKIEKLASDKGESVIFDKVLLIADADNSTVGKPYIIGAKVTGKISEQGKDKKIRVFKYKAKSKYRRTSGHRQLYTAVNIAEIAAK